LTGVESYKPDVKKWLEEIILEFQIGKVIYTVYIDKTGRDKGALYSFGIDKFLELKENHKLSVIEKEKEFEFKNKRMLEENMQEFFFDHFSFYTLKYTQKNSSKENFELSTANLSWATYFKSIYLESSNYEYLFFGNEKFGAQGRKIFEMILGLPLTYPINMLGIQLDKISEEIGKLKLIDKSKNNIKASEKIELEKRHDLVKKDLKKLREGGRTRFDEKPLIEEYNQIQGKINQIRKEGRTVKELYLKEKEKFDAQETEIKNLLSDENKVIAEINRLIKQELNIKLYKEAGSFFSNLEIKVCPHCDTEVTEQRKDNEREKHECSLCGETSTEKKVEEDELLEKLNRVKEEKLGHQEKLNQIQLNIKEQKNKSQSLKKFITHLSKNINEIPSIDSYNERLKAIEKQIEAINNERKNQQKLIEEEQSLIKEEAVLEFRLEKIKKEKKQDNSKKIEEYSLKKAVLNYALNLLQKKRNSLNKDIGLPI
jgi:hypothetical protein